MNPRRTHLSNFTYTLPGGNEDNDLWVCRGQDGGGLPTITSTWVPTIEERRAIMDGANIDLTIIGVSQPPVRMSTTDVRLGKAPDADFEEEETS